MAEPQQFRYEKSYRCTTSWNIQKFQVHPLSSLRNIYIYRFSYLEIHQLIHSGCSRYSHVSFFLGYLILVPYQLWSYKPLKEGFSSPQLPIYFRLFIGVITITPFITTCPTCLLKTSFQQKTGFSQLYRSPTKQLGFPNGKDVFAIGVQGKSQILKMHKPVSTTNATFNFSPENMKTPKMLESIKAGDIFI